MVINYNDYFNDGWGISRLGFEQLYKLIEENPQKTIRIVEFGSGISTKFFSDVSKILNKEVCITSFDDNEQFMYKDTTNPNVVVNLRELEETYDANFIQMFNEKRYRSEFMYKKTTPLSTRQHNNFYKLNPNDLVGIYDYVLLDGPNGNGRSIAFLHLKSHLAENSVVFIDDFTHYDFVPRFLSIFNAEEIFKNIGGSGATKWNIGGDFIIFKVK